MIEVHHGDCISIMGTLQNDSVDMVMTDPPYGVTACSWDSVIPLDAMWREIKRIIKPNGVIVFTAIQPFTTRLISSNYKMFKYCWVWEKNVATNFYHAKHSPLRKHEDVLVFCSGVGTYNPQKTHGHKPTNAARGINVNLLYHGDNERNYGGGNTDRYPTTIIKMNSVSIGDRTHPTQKPLELMTYLVNTYTNEGDVVLDFAMGSGTTGIACVNTNRSFIGVEINDSYIKDFNIQLNKTILKNRNQIDM